MIILECPNCQSCFTAEDWNKSPHIGDAMPENINTDDEFNVWNKDHSGRFDCPDCGEVALTEDMIVV